MSQPAALANKTDQIAIIQDSSKPATRKPAPGIRFCFPLPALMGLSKRRFCHLTRRIIPGWLGRRDGIANRLRMILPLPRGEGRGEGELARRAASRPSPVSGCAVTRADARGAIVRKRMGRSLQEDAPDNIPNELLFLPEVRIPKSQDLHAVSFQPRIPFRIRSSPLRESVLTAIQLDIQARFQTKEIQNISTHRLLSPKLIGGEPPVSQPAPNKPFSPGIVLAQCAGNGDLFGMLHPWNLGGFKCNSPSPRPSPRGRGRTVLSWLGGTSRNRALAVCDSPSPFGRGPG